MQQITIAATVECDGSCYCYGIGVTTCSLSNAYTEMRFKDKVASPCYELNWAYINFLQVGKNIIMSKFNIKEDAIAQQYIQAAFPDCNIEQIEMAEIAKEGGALHCISLYKLECISSKITCESVNHHP